jgi:L-fuconolactonase
MKDTVRRALRCLTAAAALLGMAWGITACGGGSSDDELGAAVAQAFAAAPAGKRPVVDTHIHFWQKTRPGGIPWPTDAEGPIIFRDVLPPEYSALVKPMGVVKTVVIEASPIIEDNQVILDMTKSDPLYFAFVGNIDIGAPNFTADLARFAANPRFVGLRGYLTGPAEGITLSAAQMTSLKDLAARGMTLDIISRGDKNPKSQVLPLCQAVPNLRIIIDHLGGARGATPDPTWVADINKLASSCPNMYMKFSSFYDMYASGDVQEASPTTLSAYKANFDVLMNAFGQNRLIFGSNWPVIDLHGTFANQLAIAEEYLAPMGTAVRDKVMFINALSFYRRRAP